jgi:ClpP class serine protease
MNYSYLRKLLLNPNKMLITAEGYASAMLECFPLPEKLPAPDNRIVKEDFFSEEKTYEDKAKEHLKDMLLRLSKSEETKQISLSADFQAENLPDNSIAYHQVFGIITAGSCWYFSSKILERDLLSAEANPAFSVHFIHINSPGGEAWYLDRLSETMRNLQKPVFVLIENLCASAGYYIACHGKQIRALTQNDTIGCIGTMVDYYDFEGYLTQLGIKRIKAKAHRSDLKNKKYEDLKSGKPEQFITEELDPLAEQFISEVRQCRPRLKNLPDDDPVFRGETFSTETALQKGLIDGACTLPKAILKAHRLGCDYSDAITLTSTSLEVFLT